jgi:hypothetical protein
MLTRTTQILADDRGGHRPERIEVDVQHLGLHDRRLAIDLADARRVMAEHLTVFDGFHRRCRDVHRDKALTKIAGIAAEANEIELELAEALLRRDVERLKRLLRDDAAGADAVARLKAHDARLHERIENRRFAGRLGNIARDHEAAAQRADGLPLRADLQGLPGRHLRPAALIDEVAILLNGGFGRRDRLLRQDRGGRALDAQPGVRVVFLLPFRLIAGLRINLRGERAGGAENRGKTRGRHRLREQPAGR